MRHSPHSSQNNHMKKKPTQTPRLQVRAEVCRDLFNFIETYGMREHLRIPDIVRKALYLLKSTVEKSK